MEKKCSSKLEQYAELLMISPLRYSHPTIQERILNVAQEPNNLAKVGYLASTWVNAMQKGRVVERENPS